MVWFRAGRKPPPQVVAESVPARPLSPDPVESLPPESGNLTGRVDGHRSQILRLVALVVVLLLAVVVAVTVLQRSTNPTVDDLRRQAGWTDLESLNIGVYGDIPGVSNCTKVDCAGFDVEIARLVADWLGVRSTQISWATVLPDDRARMQGTSIQTGRPVDVDLVVAAYSITKPRQEEDKVVFAGPYLDTQTTVLTRKIHPAVESLYALDSPLPGEGRGPKKDDHRQLVCTAGATTSNDYLSQALRVATIVRRQRNAACVKLLLDKQVDAVVTDAAILAGFQAEHPKELRLNNISSSTDEHWGIGVGRDFTGDDKKVQARQQLVLLALNDLLTEPNQRRWFEAYKQLPPPVETPGYDTQVVADYRQPLPWGLKKVRRWPWDHSGTGSGR